MTTESPFEQGFNGKVTANPFPANSAERQQFEDGQRAGVSYRAEKKNLPPEEATKVTTQTTSALPAATTPSEPVAPVAPAVNPAQGAKK